MTLQPTEPQLPGLPETLTRGTVPRPFAMIPGKLSLKVQHLEKGWALTVPTHGLMNEFWAISHTL